MLKIEKIHFEPVKIRTPLDEATRTIGRSYINTFYKRTKWYIICVVYSIFYMCVIRSMKCKNDIVGPSLCG